MKVNYTPAEVKTIRRFLNNRLDTVRWESSSSTIGDIEFSVCKCCDALTCVNPRDICTKPKIIREASIRDKMIVELLRTLNDVAVEEEDDK
jgi:hypothetical protein